jgi:hypothetical protein
MPWVLPQLEYSPLPLMEEVRSVCYAVRGRMLGAGSWPSMIAGVFACHYSQPLPRLNLQLFSGGAPWVAVLGRQKHTCFRCRSPPIAVLADSANVNVNTAPLCLSRCALGFERSLVAGHDVCRHSRVSDLNFSGSRDG